MDIKIPLYNFLNMFLIGLVFIGCSIFLLYDTIDFFNMENLSLIKDSGLKALITIFVFSASYEVGFIINRFGSIIIEPILIKLKLVHFSNDYKKFNEYRKNNPIIDILSREYALARSSIALFIILGIISIIMLKYVVTLIFIFISILFLLSAKKHGKKISILTQ